MKTGPKPKELAWRVTDSGCWEVTSHEPGSDGYVTLSRERIKAHRYMYEREVGPILEGLWVLHRCDNRFCVNPAHLFLGTAADNAHDMCEKGRRWCNAGERHGHAKLTEADVLYIREHTEINGAEMGRRLGVTPSVICGIRKRRTWRHI